MADGESAVPGERRDRGELGHTDLTPVKAKRPFRGDGEALVWFEAIQQFTGVEVLLHHIAGVDNTVADDLSRDAVERAVETLRTMAGVQPVFAVVPPEWRDVSVIATAERNPEGIPGEIERSRNTENWSRDLTRVGICYPHPPQHSTPCAALCQHAAPSVFSV